MSVGTLTSMSKQIPHSVRRPDYGIPYKVIARGSWTQYILSYACFVARINPPGVFGLADYRKFRTGDVRRDYFTNSTKKLVSLGYLMQLPDEQFKVTTKGIDASIRIGKRNAAGRFVGDDD